DQEQVVDPVNIQSLELVDIDNDTFLDIAVHNKSDNKIYFLKNSGTATPFTTFTEITAPAEVNEILNISYADMDNDGDMDMLVTVDTEDSVKWYENDGSGNFIATHAIATDTYKASAVIAEDMDGDGDLDVFVNSDSGFVWHENTFIDNNSPTFIEDGAAVVLVDYVTISDAELDALNGGLGNYDGASLTLVRNGGANAEDVFSNDLSSQLDALTNGGNLVYNSTTIGTVTTNSGGTLVLTFNGNATTALVNSAMQSIAYSNSNNTPPATAQIDWSFNDGNSGAQGSGGDMEATRSTTVTIIPVNDEPTLSATASNPTFNEGGAAAGLFSGASVSTVEAGQTITGLTFTVTNVTDTGNEQITIDGTTITLDDLESGTTTDFNYSVSVAGSTATVTLSGGTVSTANVEADINGATYQNTSQDPTDANRVVTITQIVDSGGTANGGDDTGTPNIVSTVNVDPVNDEPTLTATGSNPTFNEGGAAVGLFSGASVSTVEAGQTITGLTFTVTNVTDTGNEQITIDGTTITLDDLESGSTTDFSYSVAVAGSTATVTLS
ncbi:MAG: hypothetical protein GY926_16060, partial [bacterium]|nr:hypothetical protein [bacterium]